MQLIQPSSKSSVRGVALILTLVIVGVMLTVFASIFYWANTNAKITQRNNQYNMSQNAAEAAVETVVGRIDRDFVESVITNGSSGYAAQPTLIDQTSWPIQYMFSSTNGTTGTVDVVFAPQNNNVVALNSEYAGLSGMSQGVDVWATATPSGQMYNVPATVHESLQFAYIPLFQFAIFYNVNLEIDPGAAMTITGPVFCNQSIWEGSSVCTFASSVTAVDTNYIAATGALLDPFCVNYNGTGTPTFNAGPPLNNANSLVMPIGTNNSPGAILGLLNIPPDPYRWGDSATYSSNGIVYPANGADLVISNFVAGTNSGTSLPRGTNMLVYYQDFGLTPCPYDYYVVSNYNNNTGFVTNWVNPALLGVNTNIYYAGYSWVTNVNFGDWREGYNSGRPKSVLAIQIDMSLLQNWLTNNATNGNFYRTSGAQWDSLKVLHSGSHMASSYVVSAVPLGSSQMPGVRVTNGGQLPHPGGSTRGWTVATPLPIYVWKDYNCTNVISGVTYSGLGSTNTANSSLPAALMGDSVTVLSDAWVDHYPIITTPQAPSPANTTVNAAMLEGIVASVSTNYSGGVENFMRLLENWGGTTLTYNGSIVVLFYSQYATNLWSYGNYYDAPSRNWAFDLNFKNANKLPPLTPDSKAMIRGNWYAHQ